MQACLSTPAFLLSRDPQKLRDGVYLLRTAIVQNRDYDTSNTYVASADKLVNVMAGKVSTELTYQTQDLKALGNRNNLLVELYAVDENKITVANGQLIAKNAGTSLESLIDYSSELESPTFVSQITLNADEGSRNMTMVDPTAVSQLLIDGHGQNISAQNSLIKKVVEQGQKDLAEKRQRIQDRSEKSQFAKDNNLEVITLKTADEQAPLVKSLTGSTSLNKRLIVSKADLQELIEKGSLTAPTAQKLCAFWSQDYFRTMYSDKGGVFPNFWRRPSFGLRY